MAPSPSVPAPAPQRRAYWLKTLHQWHWISSSICLIGMLLFAITGITLNNAGHITAKPQVSTLTETLPPAMAALLKAPGAPSGDKANAPLPPALRAWIAQALKLELDERDAEWSPEEVYLSLPRPGGDAWLRIDREAGELEYERTDRGWVSYFNDLHKGRHTGTAWSWFLDVFAVACLVFSVTGLFILKMHASNRPTTWPLIGAGLVIPLLLAILFIH
ncbi:MAG TPA: PepSY-associated TM helix domain-containing protein [Ideonella sp.]|nr:PepSY-associated TM helix domain-containing protein [Ideonella sp.]